MTVSVTYLILAAIAGPLLLSVVYAQASLRVASECVVSPFLLRLCVVKWHQRLYVCVLCVCVFVVVDMSGA